MNLTAARALFDCSPRLPYAPISRTKSLEGTPGYGRPVAGRKKFGSTKATPPPLSLAQDRETDGTNFVEMCDSEKHGGGAADRATLRLDEEVRG